MTDSGATFPTAAIITASAAILVWALTRLYETYREYQKISSDADKYITALYAEIDFNTRDMEIFLSESASIEAAVAKVRSDRDFIPHITDARHTDIYAETLENINHIGKDQIGQLVNFYGLMEKLKNQVSGIYLPSFGKISANGREATIREIAETAADCAAVGSSLLASLEHKYAEFGLKRNPRTKSLRNMSDSELLERHKQLSSDLDGVNAKHFRSPSK